ncbi:hypothetical protein CAPTEDRAFT_161019 [Capitella teleta]|uniref:ARF7 effector protein C-terminal domain-containing protein n=1 Tax=Capitella teleta TaxID=283909 RepID=R7US39_CAPTE|nr:hypothetical protein CAPTEDRAFT_161019 [Capitella teleta]|eukprot:ELU06727.1 hypothetical protein CAPTEDRAFT_161019 [Capitella teleta]
MSIRESKYAKLVESDLIPSDSIDIDSSSSDFDDPEDETERQLKKLQFVNPGRFMDNFDPERSSREMRKVNRRIYKETVRKNQVYDSKGRLLHNSQKHCDCLQSECPGCHFPCPKCGSTRCGAECQSNRRWYYCEVEVEGTSLKRSFKIEQKAKKKMHKVLPTRKIVID